MQACIDLRTVLAVFQMYFEIRERLSGPRCIMLDTDIAVNNRSRQQTTRAEPRTFPGQSMHLIRRSYSPLVFLRVTTSKMSSGYFACIACMASVIHCGTAN